MYKIVLILRGWLKIMSLVAYCTPLNALYSFQMVAWYGGISYIPNDPDDNHLTIRPVLNISLCLSPSDVYPCGNTDFLLLSNNLWIAAQTKILNWIPNISSHSRFRGSVNCRSPSMEDKFHVANFQSIDAFIELQCQSIRPLFMRIFRGLSLALRSHDQVKASGWSTLLCYQT